SLLELCQVALDLRQSPLQTPARRVQARREPTLVHRHREADRAPMSRLVCGRPDRLVLDVACQRLVEGELLLIEVEGDRVGLPLGEDLPHHTRLRVGERDESLLRATEIERRALPTHRLLEATDMPVDVAIEELQEQREVLRIALVRRRRQKKEVIGPLREELA